MVESASAASGAQSASKSGQNRGQGGRGRGRSGGRGSRRRGNNNDNNGSSNNNSNNAQQNNSGVGKQPGNQQRGQQRQSRRGGRPARSRGPTAYRSPEGEMNGHLQTLQDQIELVSNAELREELLTEQQSLLDLRKSFYLAKGNDKREEASELLHQKILPQLRSVVAKLEESDKRNPMEEFCISASNRQAEKLFLYDNTSVGSLSSTEADLEDFTDDEQEQEKAAVVVSAGATGASAKGAGAAKNENSKSNGRRNGGDATRPNQGKKQDNSSRNEKSNNNNRKNKKKAKEDKWWRSLTDIDPISMDSLSDLPYPPFTIIVKVNNSSGEGTTEVKQHFDGKMLAHYIVSTGNFSNPNNRQPLTRQTCIRLDQYLMENRLPAARVTDAFDLSKALMIRSAQSSRGANQDENMERRATALRREATVLMSSMFNFSSRDQDTYQEDLQAHIAQSRREANPGFHGQRRTDASVHREGNLHVIDDNEWNVTETSGIEDVNEFPELPSGSAGDANAVTMYQRPQAPALAPEGVPRVMEPRAPSWPGRGPGGASQSVPSMDSFPAQQAGAGPRPVTVPGAWGASSASAGPSMASIVGSSAPAAPAAPAALSRPSSRFESLSSGTRAFGQSQTDESRPRLSLQSRTAPSNSQMQSLRPSSNQSIFGNAMPREQVLSSQGIDPRSREVEASGSSMLSASLDGYLCPYMPSFVAEARRIGMDLVGRIEGELLSFLRGPATVRTKSLPVMRTETRRFFHKLAQDYYGLHTSSIDPEPNRHIVLQKTPNALEPEMTVIQAILKFGNLLAAEEGDYSNSAPTLVRQRSHEALGENSIAIWGVTEISGGGRISSNSVTSALENVARRSTFHVRTLDGENVLLEFSDKAIARKTLCYLKAQRENKLGPIAWQQVQWWPVRDDWALHQLRMQSATDLAENRRKREERRLQSRAARFQEQARTATNTGWDSDEEAAGGGSSSRGRRPQQGRQKNANGAVGQSQNTLWDDLADSDSDDDN